MSLPVKAIVINWFPLQILFAGVLVMASYIASSSAKVGVSANVEELLSEICTNHGVAKNHDQDDSIDGRIQSRVPSCPTCSVAMPVAAVGDGFSVQGDPATKLFVEHGKAYSESVSKSVRRTPRHRYSA